MSRRTFPSTRVRGIISATIEVKPSRIRSITVGLLGIGIMLCSSIAQASSTGVTLYDEEGFRGDRQIVDRDQPFFNRRDPVGDDRTRSVRVDRGCEVVLYSKPNFRGRSVTLRRDEESLRRTDVGLDNVSSLRVDCRHDPSDGGGWGDGPYDDGFYDDDGHFGYGDGALLFKDKNLQGRSIRVDRDIPNLRRSPLGNDQLTSLKVARGCRVTLYRDFDFRGERLEVDGTINNLKHTRLGNDRASSIRIDCDRDPMGNQGFRGAVLYRDSGFRGRAEIFERDDPRLSDNAIGNDRVSSVRVSRGCEITLYRDDGYRGRSTILDRDASSLDRSAVGNDGASSVRVECRRGGAPGRPDRPQHGSSDLYGVTLYTDDGFRGARETFLEDVPNLKRSRFGNDRASSIRIDRGCRVTLYSDKNYSGRSVTLNRGEHRLRNTRVGNDALSSMRVSCRRRR